MADEKYRIKGDTLIINDGETTVEGRDFDWRGWRETEKLNRIKEIIVPDSVTSIGEGAFEGFNSTNISIPDSVTNIGNKAFYHCRNLKSITIPDSVTSIGRAAFCGCSSLKSITIPDSVTSIGNCAFHCCENIKSITIPDSVTSIDDCAFLRCEKLTITCNKGSYAEKYAKENNIPVKYIKDKAKAIERE